MNLKELAKSKGTNIKRIAETCGIPASTLYAISSGETTFDNVGIGAFRKVAAELGMTSDELYGAVADVHYAVVSLSDDDERDDRPSHEKELLDILRNITPEGVNQLMIYARGIAATYPKNNQLRGAKTA